MGDIAGSNQRGIRGQKRRAGAGGRAGMIGAAKMVIKRETVKGGSDKREKERGREKKERER